MELDTRFFLSFANNTQLLLGVGMFVGMDRLLCNERCLWMLSNFEDAIAKYRF